MEKKNLIGMFHRYSTVKIQMFLKTNDVSPVLYKYYVNFCFNWFITNSGSFKIRLLTNYLFIVIWIRRILQDNKQKPVPFTFSRNSTIHVVNDGKIYTSIHLLTLISKLFLNYWLCTTQNQKKWSLSCRNIQYTLFSLFILYWWNRTPCLQS